ncbi:MAG: adenylate/guanylate cyclase domain-containing protein [Alphaproteobacteria bacterium]
MNWLRRLRNKSSLIAPILMLVIGSTLSVHDPQFLRTFRLKVFDLYQQIEPRHYEPVPVKIIDIDEESLRRLGQFPWPRTKLAQMLVTLFEGGARVVAFDITFPEPDRTSPEQVLPTWLDVPKLDLENLPEAWRNFAQAILESVPDHDLMFAEAITQTSAFDKQHGVVVGFAFNDDAAAVSPKSKAGFAYAFGGGDEAASKAYVPQFSGTAGNLEVIEDGAAGIGSFNMSPDIDSIVRRVPLVLRGPDGGFYPSLAAEALRVYQGASGYIVKAAGASGEESFGEHTGLNHIRIGRIEVPVDASGSMWVHYSNEVADRYVPAWKVFEPDFDPKLIEGHILFVGTSAAGLKDLRSTPLRPDAAGVEVHVQAVEQILQEHFLQRPDWGAPAEQVFMVLLGLILIAITTRWGAAVGAVVGAMFVAGAAGGSWYLYTELRYLTDPLYPAMVCLLVYLASSLLSYLSSEAQRRQIRGAFAQYMSPDLVEQVADNPNLLRLGGATKNMTFMFSDVRGFTAISETFKSNPQGLTNLINRFLTPMTNTIMARRGTIDKYMGDCIMAFWNAPLDDPDHVQNACESALAMQHELIELNALLKAEAEAEDRIYVPLNIGIGINTGDCVVGNMGSDQRFDYSVLGDAVNLASRLEGQSKTYGVTIVVGEDTAAQAPDYALLELDKIAVKGRAEAARVYTILGDQATRDDPAFQALLPDHEAMIEAYRDQRWDEAESLLRACRAHGRAEMSELYDLYDERIAQYKETPPEVESGQKWDGVFVAKTK